MRVMEPVDDKLLQMRTTDAFLRRIDDWRCQQPDVPSRSEAIRQLIEIGLTTERGAHGHSPGDVITRRHIEQSREALRTSEEVLRIANSRPLTGTAKSSREGGPLIGG